MSQRFIIKDIEGKELGEIIFSKKKFDVKVPFPKEKEKLEKLLNSFLKEGIRDLGEVILTESKSIRSNHPLFFQEVGNQLAKRGYVPIRNKK